MPRKTIELPANYDPISRPVCMGIARDVMELCGIGAETPIYMPGEFEQMTQSNGLNGNDGNPVWNGFKKVKVTAMDRTRPGSVMQQITRQNDMPPMLEDRRLGFSVRPVYFHSDITLSFKYTCTSRAEAIKWRDSYAEKRAENRTSFQHQVAYDIPFDEDVLRVLSHVHELRENIAGYGETISEYFTSLQRRQFKVFGTEDGDMDKTTIVVPEQQVQAQGWFEFDDLPEEQKNEGIPTWTIEFTYKAMYHRCTHLYVVWPLMIHQQHVAVGFFDDRPRYAVDELPKMGAVGIRALDVIQGNVDYLPPPADGMRVPGYDEWIPGYKNQPTYSVPGISWMIALDPNDPQDILNLTQIPDLRFTLELDTYLKSMYKVLNRKGGSPILFTLYNEDLPMSEEMLTIDKDLNVRATVPLDLRRSYHLRLSFPTLYGLFTDPAIRSMQTSPFAVLQIFQSIMPQLNVDHAKAILIDGVYLPKSYIKWFYKLLEDKGIGFQGGNGGGIPGSVNTGEAGGLPGSYVDRPDGGTGTQGPGGVGGGNSGTGLIGGGGGLDNPPKDGSWGNGDHWSREGQGGNKYVQFLGIVGIRID